MKLSRTIKPVGTEVTYRRGTKCEIYKKHNFRKDYVWILIKPDHTLDKYLMMAHRYDINE